jgi:beta-mannosidase
MNKRIDLNGTWKLRWNDGQRGGQVSRLTGPDADLSRALSADVPGEVHLDLMRAGLIQEPTLGLNALSARWVEETLWHYRRTFRAPALRKGERAWLTFERLDLAAVITLNGKEVGRHANSFYPCRIDVTGVLRQGENILVVEVDSGLFHACDRPHAGYGVALDGKLHKRQWLRKPQCQFGWDWSTRLINVGISGDVSLEIGAGVRFERLVVLAELSPDRTTGTVTARVLAEGLDGATQPGTLTVTVPALGRRVTVDVEIKPGLQTVLARLTCPNPELWWPIGHGSQPLYAVEAVLRVGGRVAARDTRKVGFRHVRVNQDPHPAGGSHFVIEVNGRPIFIKGGNFVPADMIFQRIDRARYVTLVDRAIEAHFNMLRIWGGGLYESDDFYELCDERGLLVWQEFIFACAKYPATDEAFLADVKREATHQIRRLAHHPSLVVWCGNNEMEQGNYSWGYEKGVAHPDYALFHMVLPVLLQKEDGTRYYQPSSPFSPNHADPQTNNSGDQHPWVLGFGDDDLRDYRKLICRFPNEGGILGSTALPTVRACLVPGQEHVGSFAWEVHDNSVAYWHGTSRPDETLVHHTGVKLADLSLEEWTYWAGVVQGEGLHEYIRNFRRRMFDCASAIFWMYNDCWPAVRSWTIVDYYLRRTPSFHPVRRAFQPVTVALAEEDGEIRVYGVNEGPAWRGELRYGIFGLGGGRPLDQRKQVVLPANQSTLLAAFPGKALTRLGETRYGTFAILSVNGREIARDRLFRPRVNEMKWNRPRVTVRLRKGRAVFSSDGFAWRVCLDLDGERALPDNFFDILPGIPVVLDWPASLGKPRILRVGNRP